jgi:hypothetical protein
MAGDENGSRHIDQKTFDGRGPTGPSPELPVSEKISLARFTVGDVQSDVNGVLEPKERGRLPCTS